MEYEFENSDALDYLAECTDGYSRIFRVVGSRTIKATFEASKTRWMIIELDF